jgi:hypothetical protein
LHDAQNSKFPSFVKREGRPLKWSLTQAIETSPTNNTTRTDSSENFPGQENKVTPAPISPLALALIFMRISTKDFTSLARRSPPRYASIFVPTSGFLLKKALQSPPYPGATPSFMLLRSRLGFACDPAIFTRRMGFRCATIIEEDHAHFQIFPCQIRTSIH